MKLNFRPFFLVLFTLSSISVAFAQAGTDSIKYLTIGNSFANDSMSFFPKIAEANGKKIELGRANLGGCTLERHVRHLRAYEANPADPEGSPYPSGFYPSKNEPKTKKYSLRELLEADRWDYVSIQQASPISFKAESFEPYAGILVEYVRKYAPQAKIIILQTWAYREDYPGFAPGQFTQEKMYDALRQNYEKLAADYNMQIVPVGFALQNARANDRWKYKFPDPSFDYQNPPEGKIPVQPGSLNSGWYWKEGKMILDFKHCNTAGKYLAASVFYEALFGADVRNTIFVPEKMDPAEAAELRRIAHESFASYQGTKVQAKPSVGATALKN